jgi:hypothetical protein
MKIIKKTIKIIFLTALLVSIGYLSAVIFSLRSAQKETVAISNENSKGKILGEEGGQPISNTHKSENFRSPQISLGGEAITFPSGQQAINPEILDLRSELLTTKTDRKAKFMLTWRTNKPCLSSVEYLREGEAEGKVFSEDGYGINHSAEISPLAFSTSYSYTVFAKDKWGNEINSDKLAFYTGAPNVSILDLLGNAFKDMFGWASR